MSDTVPDEIKAKLLSEGKFLVSKIDADTIESIERWILRNRIGDNPKTEFTLLINSGGGNPGLIVYFASFLRTLSDEVKIKAIAFGECGSAALALLQCCHERVAVKHCGFFIHNISDTFTVGCQDINISEIRDRIESCRKLEKELAGIQAKRCGMSTAKWKSLAKKGQANGRSAILTDEAKKLGLIDRIIDNYHIF